MYWNIDHNVIIKQKQVIHTCSVLLRVTPYDTWWRIQTGKRLA